jgi:hypothetical protein
MDDRRSSNKPPLFDLLDNPFHFLGVHPTAMDHEVLNRYATAENQASAPLAILQLARDAILDPSSRLFVELNYLIDSNSGDIASAYAILSQTTSAKNLIDFAERLGPIARANFLAHVAARRPPGSDVLCALVEAHASLDVASIYATLKAIRTEANHVAPSLLSVNQSLEQLLHNHARTIVASYDTVEDAASPLLACVQHMLSDGQRYRQQALERVLGVYRRALEPRLANERARVASACDALSTQPTDTWTLNELTTALHSWILISGPLLAYDAHQACDSQDAGDIVARLRKLIRNLTTDHRYDIALNLAVLARQEFDPIFQSANPFADDVRLIERWSLDSKLMRLDDFIDQVGRASPLLAADLNNAGLGPQSVGQAKQFWEILLETTAGTTSAKPWRLITDFAIDFAANTQHHAASLALLTGLIRHGEQTSVAPAILHSLQRELQRLKSRDAAEPGDANDRQTAAAQRQTPIKTHRRPTAVLVAACLTVVLCTAVYFHLDKQHRAAALPRPVAAQTLGSDAETVPPVGTGQHLELSAVRYCHYQEERLKLMKPDILGPDAVRAFNLLVVDYNSRCSDFFYKDGDLATVKAEIVTNHQHLAAEAKRMVSTTDHPDLSSILGAKDDIPRH